MRGQTSFFVSKSGVNWGRVKSVFILSVHNAARFRQSWALIMSHYYTIPLVEPAELAEARRVIGAGLPRIIGYFREDGAKAIRAIEEALQARSSRDLVLPAHTLKGDARQLGAVRLGEIAETIEKAARNCLERQVEPEGIGSEVAMLRGCFAETMAELCASEPASVTSAPPLTPTPAPAPAPIIAPRAAPLRPTPLRPAVFGRKSG